METSTPSGSASERLEALGFTLPRVGSDAKYVNHRSVDSSIYVSGQLPYKDGVLLGQGVVGRDVEIEAARGLARQAVVNCLAAAADAVGGLDRVRIVQMLIFVASTPEFGEQARVADAASDLLFEVLGENGRHARTAIGVAGLPRNSPVEIQMVCTAGATRSAFEDVGTRGIHSFHTVNPRSAACTGFNEHSMRWSSGWTHPRPSC